MRHFYVAPWVAIASVACGARDPLLSETRSTDDPSHRGDGATSTPPAQPDAGTIVADAGRGTIVADAGRETNPTVDAASDIDGALEAGAPLDAAGDITVPTTGIAGRVVYNNGQGVPGVPLRIDGVELISNADGRFFSSANPSSYSLSVKDGEDTTVWLDVTRRDPVVHVVGPMRWATLQWHMRRLSPETSTGERRLDGEYTCNGNPARRLEITRKVDDAGVYHQDLIWYGAETATCHAQFLDELPNPAGTDPRWSVNTFFGAADSSFEVSAMQLEVAIPDFVFQPFELGHVSGTLEVAPDRPIYEISVRVGTRKFYWGQSKLNSVAVPKGLSLPIIVAGITETRNSFEFGWVEVTSTGDALDGTTVDLVPLHPAVLEKPAWQEAFDTNADPELVWTTPDGLVGEIFIGEDYRQRVITTRRSMHWSELRRAGLSLTPGYHDLQVTASDRVTTVDADLAFSRPAPKTSNRVSSRRTEVLAP
jgi:hypothetical protein